MGERAGRSPAFPIVAFTLLVLSATSGAGSPQRAAIREAYAAAGEAHERKDFDAFLGHSRRLVDLAPRSTRARYNLACAQSLTGDTAGAIASLEQLAEWEVAFDLTVEPDFDSIRDTEGFRRVSARMQALEEPVGSSLVAFTLPERDLLTEGIAYDTKTGAFFVTAVHGRKVVRVGADGGVGDFVSEDALASAVGVVVDPTRRTLWVTTEIGPLMKGSRPEDERRSLLLEFDLDRRRLRRSLEPPASGGHVSDLALGPDGTVYAADARTGRVYRTRPGSDHLEVLVQEGPIVSAQGMTVSPDGRFLFVADYAQGIARVDLGTLEVDLLPTPGDLLATGIDGLVLAGDSLVGIQNGFRPHRVVRLRLDAALSQVVEGTVLERAHPRFDEPTLGVVVDGALYYVANSQYRHFAADGTPDLEQLGEPVVLRLPLPWLTPR